MALNGRLLKLAWGGRFNDIDSWTNSLMLITTGAPVKTPFDYLVPLTNWMMQNAVRHNKGAVLDFIKLNEINPLTGKYADVTVSHTHLVSPGIVNDAATVGTIPQAALACTLLTAVSRGRTSHGRIFVPYQIPVTLEGGILPVNQQTSNAATFKAFINEINAIDATAGVVVFSKIGQLAAPVTAVSVGRVIDTQRRRRRSLIEAPVRTTLA